MDSNRSKRNNFCSAHALTTQELLTLFAFLSGHPHISIYNPYKQFCKLGSAGSLVVKYTSWPPPLNITWFKYEDYQNIKLQESKRYTMTETPSVIIDSFHDAKIHVDGYVGTLYIDEVTLKDLTNFTVKIHNKFGQESFTFFLSDMTEYQGRFVKIF